MRFTISYYFPAEGKCVCFAESEVTCQMMRNFIVDHGGTIIDVVVTKGKP